MNISIEKNGKKYVWEDYDTAGDLRELGSGRAIAGWDKEHDNKFVVFGETIAIQASFDSLEKAKRVVEECL